jgi:4-alpha-glucanotransferase
MFYGAVWTSWPRGLRDRAPEAMAAWRRALSEDIERQKFLQFEFFHQWDMLKKHAERNDVLIVGDIPFFAALDSADAWANRDLFLLNERGEPLAVAGVPPDYFSDDGQLWGNPLYDWKAHENSGFEWWTRRVAHILSYTDILRIDHFRGFESYWAVPYGDKTAAGGKWRKGPGRAIFDRMRLALGDLPIIAEDLGIVTDDVTKLRDDLGLPGMKVIQFGFDSSANNLNLPHNITDYNIALYTGTHDNDTSVGWYLNANESDRDQFRRYLNVSGAAPSWDMIRLAFMSAAKYAVAPVWDVLSLGSESRMNTPGTMSGNWRFRYADGALDDSLAQRLRYLSRLYDRNAPKPCPGTAGS